MNGNFQLFKPSGGSGSGTSSSDFVKEAFQDISAPATNNVGLSSTISTNPLGGYFANDDAPKYGPKTLWITDLVLIEDRTKWQEGQPTYQIVFHEQFPGVVGYVWGAASLRRGTLYDKVTPISLPFGNMNSRYMVNVAFKGGAGGVGVTGKIRRVQWLVTPPLTTGGTVQLKVDGVSGNTLDLSANPNSYDYNLTRSYDARVDAASNETNNLHDFRISPMGAPGADNTGGVAGVVVYFENTGANLEFDPGITYVDKVKVETTSGASLALPSFGSSLGGSSVLYKDASGVYAMSSIGVTVPTSIAVGASGTNLLTVTTGQGQSFLIGQGILAGAGASQYAGVVKSISTDTLTVYPTLIISVSGPIYPYFYSSATAAISATLFGEPLFSIGATVFQGATTKQSEGFFIDPYLRYACAWNGYKQRADNPDSGIFSFFRLATGGLFQVHARAAAADIDFLVDSFSSGDRLNFGVIINGVTTFVVNETISASLTPGYLRKPLITDSGMDLKEISILPGPSHSIRIGLASVNLYGYRPENGITLSPLADLDTNQATGPFGFGVFGGIRPLPGFHQRYYSDQLTYVGDPGDFSRADTTGGVEAHGYAEWSLLSSSAAIKFQWYGKNFMVNGSLAGGGSLFVTVDGSPFAAFGANGSSFFNTGFSLAEGFHSLEIAKRGANNPAIASIDISRSHGELKNLQAFSATPATPQVTVTDWQPYVVKLVDSVTGGNVNLTITNGEIRGQYKIIDDQMLVEISMIFSQAIPNGSYLCSLPDNHMADFKRYPYGNGNDPSTGGIFDTVGTGTALDPGGPTSYYCGVALYGLRHIYPRALQTTTFVTNGVNIFSNNQITIGNGTMITMRAQITIVKPGT